MTSTRRRRAFPLVLCLLAAGLVVSVSACGDSDSTTTTAPPATTTTTAPPTTTTAAPSSTAGATSTSVALTGEEAVIAENWAAFFDGAGPVEEKAGLLENGDQYADEIQANAASPLAQTSSAAVTAVAITSPTEATVTYSILIAGQPALADQTGRAVKQDGVWKVGEESFLALLALQGGAFPTTTTTP